MGQIFSWETENESLLQKNEQTEQKGFLSFFEQAPGPVLTEHVFICTILQQHAGPEP